MSARCPEGHLSDSDDYCDTCGAPLGEAAAPAAPSSSGADAGAGGLTPAAGSPASAVNDPQRPSPTPTGAGANAQICPHCGTANPATHLFCEGCGFDFTTGVLPRPLSLAEGSFLSIDAPGAGHTAPDRDVARKSAALNASDGSPDPAETPTEPGPQPEPAEPAPEARLDTDQPADAATELELSARRTRYVPPSRAMDTSWVAEVWVDPDWYDVQSSSDPCPSPMLPDVLPLPTTSALVGRPSASRRVRPDIDCGSDSGVSRRQAQLTSDGRRWWVEDLDSSNGTYVGPASGPLPTTPLTPGRRVEVDADDRIYVGAWTRIVVRPATASEVAGLG